MVEMLESNLFFSSGKYSNEYQYIFTFQFHILFCISLHMGFDLNNKYQYYTVWSRASSAHANKKNFLNKGMDSINRHAGVLLFWKGIQKVLQPFVCDINSSDKHKNSGKIIFSVYSPVNHNVYLFMTQMYNTFGTRFKVKALQRYTFWIHSFVPTGVIDRPKDLHLHTVESWHLL